MADRMLVVWCVDWLIAACGYRQTDLVVALEKNRVVAATKAARQENIVDGLRKRDAQSRCPEAKMIEVDYGLATKQFDFVVATIEAVAPGVEIVRPGVCAVPTLGPSRYFGGDEALSHHVLMLVDEVLRDTDIDALVAIGVADGIFAARMAAGAALIIEPGGSEAFLAPQPVAVLDVVLGASELVDLLRRLGIRTLGDFAALPYIDVATRFGMTGAVAHRLCRGDDVQPFQARLPPSDYAVRATLDPPACRIDAAAFSAKTLADELQRRLGADGLACDRLAIEAQTEHGESMCRLWRHDGHFDTPTIVARVRWQLEGWLTANIDPRDHLEDLEPTGGISFLCLTPEGLLPNNGKQLMLWGGREVGDEVTRAVARVQGLLGEREVVTGVIGGGRSNADQVRFVPWGEPRSPLYEGRVPMGPVLREAVPRGAVPRGAGESMGTSSSMSFPDLPPWPGQLPAPSPATVYPSPLAARVIDDQGRLVAVDSRGRLSTGPPSAVSSAEFPHRRVVAWAGPWPVEERWWDVTQRRRYARFQLLCEGDLAFLAVVEHRKWWIEGRYD